MDGEQLEEVTEYKYLGRLVTYGSGFCKETVQGITSRWRRFWEYSQFLKDRKIPICLEENHGYAHLTSYVVNKRTVGRTCSQNEQHQVGQDNIRMDTQRRKTSNRETKKEMEGQHRGSW